MNETFILESVVGEVCVVLAVFEDSLVEEVETATLRVTSQDPAIFLAEPNIVEVVITNTDGKINT